MMIFTSGTSGEPKAVEVSHSIVLRDDQQLTPEGFGAFLAAQPDLSPTSWPRIVWLADDLPTTATNKILKRELVARGPTRPAGCCGSATGRHTRACDGEE